MIININTQTLDKIRNHQFRNYARIYVDIYQDFMTQIKKSGIQIDTQTYEEETQERLKRIARKGGIIRNSGKSVVVNDISPACIACKTGVGSVTFFISLRCHRNCFYCFNPNQEGYDFFLNPKNKRNLIEELNHHKAAGMKINHMALTGGEPLLYPDETIAFFRHAKELYPDGYTRLYTTGDHADEALLIELRDAGLDEIRFSIRLHDQEQGIRHTLNRIGLAKKFIPNVMVEMPILPGEVKVMKDVLRELDSHQIFSINLLEFCYPYYNTDVFNNLGYRVKKFPYNVLYNYWYAGGLPVSQSELDCLELIEFALDEDLSIGVHYCSLENKHTGQIYQANHGQAYDQLIYFSTKDYFLKTAKVFGNDIPDVRTRLSKVKGAKYQYNEEHNYLEFQVHKIKKLKGMDVEVGISSSIMEIRENGSYLRELKIDLCHPDQFDFSHDV